MHLPRKRELPYLICIFFKSKLFSTFIKNFDQYKVGYELKTACLAWTIYKGDSLCDCGSRGYHENWEESFVNTLCYILCLVPKKLLSELFCLIHTSNIVEKKGQFPACIIKLLCS